MKSFKILSLLIMAALFTVAASAQVQYLKSTTGKLFPYGKIKTATTTTATPAIIDTIPVTDNTVGVLEVTVVGTSAAGAGVTGKLIVRYKKVSGTLTIATADTASAVTVDSGVSGAGFAIAATTDNNAKVTITGKASTTMTWRSVITPYYNR